MSEFSRENVKAVSRDILLKIQNPHMLSVYKKFLNASKDTSEADWDAPHHTRAMIMTIDYFENEHGSKTIGDDETIEKIAEAVAKKYFNE